MTVPLLIELVAPVPVSVIFDQSIGVAVSLGLPATAWQPNSIGREVIYINAQIAANFSEVMQAGPVAGGFLTYAQGEWLTLCAYEIFDTTRIDSSSATGKITLTNATGSPYTFGVGEVRVLNETANKTYTNTNAGTVPALGSTSLTEFVADEPGSASNLTSTDTLSLVTTVPGIEPLFFENMIGQDLEGAEALRIRAREANAKASPNGPSDAYSYYAKTTVRPDGSAIGVTRTYKVEANGTVTLYLADADGALTTQDRDYVFDNVNANVVPTGITLFIPVPSAVEASIAIEVDLVTNPASTELQSEVNARIEAALVTYFASLDPGGVKASSFQGVYVNVLECVIQDAAGVAVLNATVTLPAADVPLANAEIPVLDSFTATWST